MLVGRGGEVCLTSLPRTRTGTRWAICRCSLVARGVSLRDSARLGYYLLFTNVPFKSKKKLCLVLPTTWDLSEMGGMLPSTPSPSFLCGHIPPFSRRGGLEGVTWVCSYPVWKLYMHDLLFHPVLNSWDGEDDCFEFCLCGNFAMPWGGSERDLKSKQTLDNWRLLQLNIIQRQAKNELEVLSEQLEKLEKQTQYTTGGQITNCK